jgi:hypothetical protein
MSSIPPMTDLQMFEEAFPHAKCLVIPPCLYCDSKGIVPVAGNNYEDGHPRVETCLVCGGRSRPESIELHNFPGETPPTPGQPEPFPHSSSPGMP